MQCIEGFGIHLKPENDDGELTPLKIFWANQNRANKAGILSTLSVCGVTGYRRESLPVVIRLLQTGFRWRDEAWVCRA
jgi:hypothetical protein